MGTVKYIKSGKFKVRGMSCLCNLRIIENHLKEEEIGCLKVSPSNDQSVLL
jgi:hypothetical protein